MAQREDAWDLGPYIVHPTEANCVQLANIAAEAGVFGEQPAVGTPATLLATVSSALPLPHGAANEADHDNSLQPVLWIFLFSFVFCCIPMLCTTPPCLCSQQHYGCLLERL